MSRDWYPHRPVWDTRNAWNVPLQLLLQRTQIDDANEQSQARSEYSAELARRRPHLYRAARVITANVQDVVELRLALADTQRGVQELTEMVTRWVARPSDMLAGRNISNATLVEEVEEVMAGEHAGYLDVLVHLMMTLKRSIDSITSPPTDFRLVQLLGLPANKKVQMARSDRQALLLRFESLTRHIRLFAKAMRMTVDMTSDMDSPDPTDPRAVMMNDLLSMFFDKSLFSQPPLEDVLADLGIRPDALTVPTTDAFLVQGRTIEQWTQMLKDQQRKLVLYQLLKQQYDLPRLLKYRNYPTPTLFKDGGVLVFSKPTEAHHFSIGMSVNLPVKGFHITRDREHYYFDAHAARRPPTGGGRHRMPVPADLVEPARMFARHLEESRV